jgi:hypothetical protein
MKKLVMIVSLAIATVGYSFGQEDRRMQGTEQEMTIDKDQRTEIEENELPGNIRQSLNAGEFQDWEIDEAFRVDAEARSETGVAYVIKVEKDNEKRVLHYDANGRLIHSMDKDEKRGAKKDKGRY